MSESSASGDGNRKRSRSRSRTSGLKCSSREVDLECAICMSLLDRPVILPCNHRFCADCFMVSVQDGMRATQCPTCRTQLRDSPPSNIQREFEAIRAQMAHYKEAAEEAVEAAHRATALTERAIVVGENLREVAKRAEERTEKACKLARLVAKKAAKAERRATNATRAADERARTLAAKKKTLAKNNWQGKGQSRWQNACDSTQSSKGNGKASMRCKWCAIGECWTPSHQYYSRPSPKCMRITVGVKDYSVGQVSVKENRVTRKLVKAGIKNSYVENSSLDVRKKFINRLPWGKTSASKRRLQKWLKRRN